MAWKQTGTARLETSSNAFCRRPPERKAPAFMKIFRAQRHANSRREDSARLKKLAPANSRTFRLKQMTKTEAEMKADLD